uniref:Uncharacterized protein n=1 Tax=Odontella aurita TaxID=265563 RepID=A0A6U6H910_9STRA|mmetsp:Transcript_46723/g.141574  ORF Transcript_46723/g.141574 Transcript_46723/m.141574 type:complete len:480 (+) Transcript_46723:198-1637(+)
MCCCNFQRKWDEVKELVLKDPHLSFWTDPSNARTPLHIMCRMCFGQDEVADSSNEKSGMDFLPSHIKVARALINSSHECEPVILPRPEGLDSNGEGRDEMYQVHMSVLTVQDYLGNTPLHNLCGHMRSACPRLARLILSSASDSGVLDWGNKKYSRAPKIYDLLTVKNAHGCTVLHFIGEGSAPWEVSKNVLDACNSTELGQDARLHPMLVQDDDGDTPLHFACSAGRDPRFLQYFLDDKAFVVHKANNDGRLPVDDLIVWFVDENDSDSEGDNTMPLLERATEDMLTSLWQRLEVLMVMATDETCENELSSARFQPLHAAASYQNFPSIVLRLACKLFSDELTRRDENGLVALHVASCKQECQKSKDPGTEMYAELARWNSDRENDTIITFLTSLNPDSAQLLTYEGRLPLHVAIESGKSISDIQHLLSVAPKSLEIRDRVTRLQPFMLSAIGEGASFDLIYFLLLRNPELLRCGTLR